MFVSGTPIRTDDVSGRLYQAVGDGPHPGVLVFHGAGSAGGYEQEYAALLAEHGYTVLCVEYFGAPGVRDVLQGIPLEAFSDATEWLLDRLAVSGDQVGVVGFSRGGEAALLAGSQFDVVGAVVAYVPSCYVWPAPSWMDGVGEDEPTWTLDGEPIPHLLIDTYLDEEDDSDESVGAKESDESTNAVECTTDAERQQATIAVEDISGPVLLVSGEQDTVWPSADHAQRVAERLDEHDHPFQFEHLSFPEAGHAIRVPYRFDESTASGETHRFGGTHEANARASACAWTKALQYLDEL